MRSRLLLQTRDSLRCAVKCRYGASYSALRWSSTETRKWSTPLAKQLSEAITVWFLCRLRYSDTLLIWSRLQDQFLWHRLCGCA